MLSIDLLEKSVENMKLNDAEELMNHLNELCKYKLRLAFIVNILNKGVDQYYAKKKKNETLSEEEIEILNKNFDELKEIFKIITSA